MIVNILVILTLILVILNIIWFLTDPRSLRERTIHYFGKRTPFLVSLELFIIIPQIFSSIYFPIPIGSFANMIVVFGLFLFILGVFLATWAKLIMRKNWGPPEEHDIKKQKELITSGPFSFSRNPIYFGLFITSLGYSLAVRSILFPLAFFSFIYFNSAARKEERLLAKYFGKKYLEYKKRVPRFL